MAVVGRRADCRILLGLLVLVLASPALASGVATLAADGTDQAARTADSGLGNVTFVSVQGGFGSVTDGRVVAIDTQSGETVWEFSRGGPGVDLGYYDVDPLTAEELLVVEYVSGENASVLRVNWRTGTVLDEFPVPPDTHDVDVLGGGRYVVADKYGHRVYVYDRANDTVVWEYALADHFPEYPEAGEAPSTRPSYHGGYTHLNDVDVVDDGAAFLLSPRNFDRVLLVNRSTMATEFVLGREDDPSVLFEQHNPTLLSMDPPTLLVADSENDRVVEYRRRGDGDWSLVWAYRGDLHWPRDADRLPNGNTLIVDTYNQRVLEVTPAGTVVWERAVPTMPYDVERLPYGDEPGGPTMEAGVASNPAASTSGDGPPPSRELYVAAQWVLPEWVGFGEFYALLAAVAVAALWLLGEVLSALDRFPRRT